MSGGVSEDIQRLTVVVSAVVPQSGSEFFGALPLAPQFLEVGHTEVVMHLLRYIVRGPGRPRKLLGAGALRGYPVFGPDTAASQPQSMRRFAHSHRHVRKAS